MWLSTDTALGEYIPQAPVNDEAKQHNQNLPGLGGVFNTVNLNLYHYAAKNPIKYTDPDGRITKHNDLQGFDRLKAEAKDIIQGKFKIGIFAGANITLWEALNVGAEVGLWINLSEIKDFF